MQHRFCFLWIALFLSTIILYGGCGNQEKAEMEENHSATETALASREEATLMEKMDSFLQGVNDSVISIEDPGYGWKEVDICTVESCFPDQNIYVLDILLDPPIDQSTLSSTLNVEGNTILLDYIYGEQFVLEKRLEEENFQIHWSTQGQGVISGDVSSVLYNAEDVDNGLSFPYLIKRIRMTTTADLTAYFDPLFTLYLKV